MNKIQVFGLLEHIGFYFIIIFLVLFLMFRTDIFIYLAIVSWTISVISHIIESLSEKKTLKKIIIGV
ncbi:MAG: hypothetical protein KJ906_01925 [Nanoarchaeota archaeon]|nr:hypothetical protein [Nanoarchaeota archaeon]